MLDFFQIHVPFCAKYTNYVSAVTIHKTKQTKCNNK